MRYANSCVGCTTCHLLLLAVIQAPQSSSLCLRAGQNDHAQALMLSSRSEPHPFYEVCTPCHDSSNDISMAIEVLGGALTHHINAHICRPATRQLYKLGSCQFASTCLIVLGCRQCTFLHDCIPLDHEYGMCNGELECEEAGHLL